MKRYFAIFFMSVPYFLPAYQAQAQSIDVTLHEATEKGQGAEIGHVRITQSPYGLVFTPKLHGLRQGSYGFHIHENPDCGPTTSDGKVTPAGAAGGHLDPKKTSRHSTPWDDNGHLGDLPSLYVDREGNATLPVLAPKLKTLDVTHGHALMVHVGHDNYSDKPKPLGGGGARFACGVIE